MHLLYGMLKRKQDNRYNVEQCLNHHWFSAKNNPEVIKIGKIIIESLMPDAEEEHNEESISADSLYTEEIDENNDSSGNRLTSFLRTKAPKLLNS